MAAKASGSERPLRADARRNRDLIISAAQDAFCARGPDASLEESHRRLGERVRRSPMPAHPEPIAEKSQQGRIDALEQLVRLHSTGVLDDAEFDHEKALLLDGAPGPAAT